jgi:hypothetical protein
VRFGWMKVSGGQAASTQGNPFAATVGLLGVTHAIPRDMGYPQISTGGLYNTFGDPTIFTTATTPLRDLRQRHARSRRAPREVRRLPFHLQMRRAAGQRPRRVHLHRQFSGNALADFLLGYPTSAIRGIGRGGEDGRTTGSTPTRRTTGGCGRT